MFIAVLDANPDFLVLVEVHLKRALPDCEILPFLDWNRLFDFLSSRPQLDALILDHNSFPSNLSEMIESVQNSLPQLPLILFSADLDVNLMSRDLDLLAVVDKSQISDLMDVVQSLFSDRTD